MEQETFRMQQRHWPQKLATSPNMSKRRVGRPRGTHLGYIIKLVAG